jgi:hypothetical protein
MCGNIDLTFNLEQTYIHLKIALYMSKHVRYIANQTAL